jgi:hypothetical protein
MTADGAGLEVLIEQALRDLQDAAGGAALCGISRAGASAPSVKYHEGRWAALSELSRTNDPSGSAGFAVLVGWLADQAMRTERGADANWIAYAAGGVDALTEFLPTEIESAAEEPAEEAALLGGGLLGRGA